MAGIIESLSDLLDHLIEVTGDQMAPKGGDSLQDVGFLSFPQPDLPVAVGPPEEERRFAPLRRGQHREGDRDTPVAPDPLYEIVADRCDRLQQLIARPTVLKSLCREYLANNPMGEGVAIAGAPEHRALDERLGDFDRLGDDTLR